MNDWGVYIYNIIHTHIYIHTGYPWISKMHLAYTHSYEPVMKLDAHPSRTGMLRCLLWGCRDLGIPKWIQPYLLRKYLSYSQDLA